MKSAQLIRFALVIAVSMAMLSACNPLDQINNILNPGAGTPIVTGVNPVQVPAGSNLTITGQNFVAPATVVLISDADTSVRTTLTVNSVGFSAIVAAVPLAQPLGRYRVRTTVNGQPTVDPGIQVIVPNTTPRILRFSTPTSSNTTQALLGERVTVTGENFGAVLANTTLTLELPQYAVAPALESVTPTQIVFTVPRNLQGNATHTVRVAVLGETRTGTASFNLLVRPDVPAATITNFDVSPLYNAGTALVTETTATLASVTGTNISTNPQDHRMQWLITTPLTPVISWSVSTATPPTATAIQFDAGATPLPLGSLAPFFIVNGRALQGTTIFVIARATVSNANPTSGLFNTQVTITGTNLQPASVLMGVSLAPAPWDGVSQTPTNAAGTNLTLSPTQITFRVPNVTPGTYELVLTLNGSVYRTTGQTFVVN